MPANVLLSDAAWLRSRYVGDGATIAEIAADAAAHVSTVHLWLQRHGLPARRYEIGRGEVERLLRKGRNAAEIADQLGVPPRSVRDRMYRWGLAVPASAVEYDLRQINDWYTIHEWSIARIANKLGISSRTATRLLLAANVTLRPPGRRTKESMQ
jgi:transposase